MASWAAYPRQHLDYENAHKTENRTLLSGIDELAGVHALDSDDAGSADLVAQGVTEGNLGDGGTTAGIVDDCVSGLKNFSD